uniref:Uncharacterized protein n=1 Tax=Emiliania huxleyi TaxID=2903 RepID=A0A7S3X6E4_EMIHU|mmetsp:Transcript_6631/g.19128  ORF Transcript_6631/g.19128 Transcript_6631/m.19128 type:complete len:189 (+) Transcript_6631:53-619(+)
MRSAPPEHLACAALLAAAGCAIAAARRRAEWRERQVRLVRACRAADAGAVAVQLRSGADPNAEDTQGCLPLVAAASCGRLDAVRELLRAGADINALDAGGVGCCALFAACMRGHLRVVEELCARGASRDAHKAGHWSDLDLHLAVEEELRDLRAAEEGQQSLAFHPSTVSVSAVLEWLRANPVPHGLK